MSAPAAAPAVRERSIRMVAEEVRAILDGRKTQARRVVKPQPLGKTMRYFIVPDDAPAAWRNDNEPDFVSLCPYGRPGDRLWVRETWALVPRTAYARSAGVHQTLRPDDPHDAAVYAAGWDRSRPGRWRPSIHMPRWASRLTLEITDVRVERVQDITHGDVEREGVPCPGAPHPTDLQKAAHCVAFRSLWDRLNAPRGYGWDANPWVWVLTFRRVEG